MTSLIVSSFILGIAFCAPPGVITAETIRRGLARGFRPALFVQFGSLVGDSTWALVALTGLAFLIQNTAARIILSVLGMILLLKLAFDALKESRQEQEFSTTPISGRGDFATGAVLSLSNPFNIVFWSSVGTGIFAGIPGGPQMSHFVIFYLSFLGGAFVWCFFLAGLVAWGRRFVTPAFFRWVNLLCGLFLGWFAIQLGWQMIQSLVI